VGVASDEDGAVSEAETAGSGLAAAGLDDVTGAGVDVATLGVGVAEGAALVGDADGVRLDGVAEVASEVVCGAAGDGDGVLAGADAEVGCPRDGDGDGWTV
jgi:hypothetical protein